ncbi:hypothetical protein B5G04_14000 [Bacteroides sp. An51A]|nr:hypothetical protein B5G04_14000 [Bacteroides sp. An51A]
MVSIRFLFIDFIRKVNKNRQESKTFTPFSKLPDILSAPPHPLALNVYSWIIRKKGTSIRNPCME